MTAVCNVQWDSNYTSVPAGNETMTYHVLYQTSLGVGNKNRILIWQHPGAGKVPRDNVNSLDANTAAQMVKFAQDGWNVYLPTYTLGTALRTTAQINSGSTTGTFVDPAIAHCGNYCYAPPSGNLTAYLLIDTGDNAEVLTVSNISANMQSGAATLTFGSSTITHANATNAWFYSSCVFS